MSDATVKLTSEQRAVIVSSLLTNANRYEKQASEARQECNRGMPDRFRTMALEYETQATENRRLASLLNSAGAFTVEGASHV